MTPLWVLAVTAAPWPPDSFATPREVRLDPDSWIADTASNGSTYGGSPYIDSPRWPGSDHTHTGRLTNQYARQPRQKTGRICRGRP